MAIALFHFHHLLSSKKTAAIRALSRELGLSGVYKRGYPGLLFVSTPRESDAELEDHQDQLRTFVKKVKSMQWQSCTLCGGGIKAEWSVVFGEGRRGVEEVGAIRDVVAAAREGAGGDVEAWVKRSLGLGKEG
jgi:hypothetical protein